jgi:transposase-like protein
LVFAISAGLRQHVSALLAERGLAVDASCIWRWVQAYAAELNKRCRPHLKATNKSYRADETYIKVKGQEKYLYRAVDSTGQTIDFLLTAKGDAAAAKLFFRKVFRSSCNPIPRVINVDKNPAYPAAMRALKREGILPASSAAAAMQIPQQHRRAGSPVGEKTYVVSRGLRFVSERVANT